MIAGSKSALEIGCADAFATRIVRQAVDSITAVDFDPIFVENANENASHRWPVKVLQHDILRGPVPGEYDAAYSLDVFEHIDESQESLFLSNIIESLTTNGVLIIGSPSLESQAYASEGSKRGHVNCKSGEKLKSTMKAFFHNVFIFSMNDEVVHTGYYPMAHYLLAVCCSPRKNK
jgi:cyclopropane fatty-acyl-phospholipid synthase-like methyltransferase